MIVTIKAGVLHTDAHDGNWFVRFGSASQYPEIVLGDWGSHETRPQCDDSEDELRKWFESAHLAISIHLIDRLQGYIVADLPRVGSFRRDQLQYLIDEEHDYVKPLETLVQYMNALEDTTPSQFPDGDAWLAYIRNMYNSWEIFRCRHFDTLASVHHYHNLRCSFANVLPPYESAVRDMERLQDKAPGCHDLWLVADLVPLNRIVGLQRPPTFSGQYEDATVQSELRSEWRRAQNGTSRLVEELLVDDVQDTLYMTAV